METARLGCGNVGWPKRICTSPPTEHKNTLMSSSADKQFTHHRKPPDPYCYRSAHCGPLAVSVTSIPAAVKRSRALSAEASWWPPVQQHVAEVVRSPRRPAHDGPCRWCLRAGPNGGPGGPIRGCRASRAPDLQRPLLCRCRCPTGVASVERTRDQPDTCAVDDRKVRSVGRKRYRAREIGALLCGGKEECSRGSGGFQRCRTPLV